MQRLLGYKDTSAPVWKDLDIEILLDATIAKDPFPTLTQIP